ncbi:MAG: BamA/TamA family outer membrane protein [Candidatus Marinimicrobia bacterium]|nr:BamA/TamA family outer membrane protein [Candidatus Neomarinimicrobiota bacterium]
MIKYFFSTIYLFVFSGFLLGQVQDTTYSDSVALDSHDESDLYEGTGNELKFFGDYYIGINEIVKDDIQLFGGNLFVAGTVLGKITVLGGDVTLESTAVVNGRIVAIGGSIITHEGAEINGTVVEANIREGISFSDKGGKISTPDAFDFQVEELKRHPDRTWIHPDNDWFSYNRNEGFVFTPFNFRWNRKSKSSFQLSLSLGYRFGQNELTGRLTLEKYFFRRHNFVLFASGFHESESDDTYRLPNLENSLAALFARQDFYDRWDEEGFELGFGINFSTIRFRVAYHSVYLDSISITNRQATWLHADRAFRPNLPIIPGNVESYLATLSVKTRGFQPLGNGIGAIIDGEQVITAENYHNFTRILTTVMANWEISEGIVLRNRFLFGTTEGTLPFFRNFTVGGLGSVSAHPYKPSNQTGSQMVQANVELVFLPDFLDKDWVIFLFADGGNAWDSADYNLTDFNSISKNGISSIGVGLGDDDLDWRINIARPLDGRDTWETTFRLNMNF